MRTKPLLACALAAVFALSGCGQAAEPAAEEAPASSAATESPEAAEATKASVIPSIHAKPVTVNPQGVADYSGGDKQAAMRYIAESYAFEMTRNKFALSGKWVEEGQRTVDIASVFSNFYSPELQQTLREMQSSDELEGKMKFPLMALGTGSDNGEPIASKLCMDSKNEYQNYCTISSEGMFVGKLLEETIAYPEENRITFDFHTYIPIRITQGYEDGNYPEGYMDSTINFDLTFVENADASNNELPYYIDSVNNTFKEKAVQRHLADDPKLAFEPRN